MFRYNIAHFILRHRFTLAVLLGGLTALMGYQASKVRLSYELAQILPKDDPDFQLYESFKARYGEDGNVWVIGVATDSMFSFPVFRDWYALSQRIKKLNGVKEVISNANSVEVVRNDRLKRFDFLPIVVREPNTQAETDSIKATFSRLPFYRGFIVSDDGKAHLMTITPVREAFRDKNINTLSNQIKQEAEAFGKAHRLEVHLSGLPYIRTELAAKVRQETIISLLLALMVAGLISTLFFRSLTVTLISWGGLLIGVIWSVGFIGLFNYELTPLMGIIPALTVVIGIPNSLFLTTRYRKESERLHNQSQARERTVEKTVKTAFGSTIAIGFGVFYLTNSQLLPEFGLISALSVMCMHGISLVLAMVLYRFLPPPNQIRPEWPGTRYIRSLLKKTERWVHHRQAVICNVTAALIIFSPAGIMKIKATGSITDELPENDPILTDLAFFEKHFKGLLPFEINIDTGRPGRVMTPQTLTKIKLLQKEFARYPEFTKPLSVVEAAKFIYQGYRGGDSAYFVLPPAPELTKLAEYAGTFQGNDHRLRSFMDSTHRYTRVSFQIADVGTRRTTALYSILQSKIDSLFNIDAETGKRVEKEEQYEVKITGSSVITSKGKNYLLTTPFKSSLLAILLIITLMTVLFGHWRMVLAVMIPGLLPLIITAGVMGWAGVSLSPSTTLVFSMAFGLSADGTVSFLSRYRHELIHRKSSVGQAVSHTIELTGVGIFYTTAILFAGFTIFTASAFKGTATMGILVGITLLMGMLSNLILLPTFLLWMNKKFGKSR